MHFLLVAIPHRGVLAGCRVARDHRLDRERLGAGPIVNNTKEVDLNVLQIARTKALEVELKFMRDTKASEADVLNYKRHRLIEWMVEDYLRDFDGVRGLQFSYVDTEKFLLRSRHFLNGDGQPLVIVEAYVTAGRIVLLVRDKSTANLEMVTVPDSIIDFADAFAAAMAPYV